VAGPDALPAAGECGGGQTQEHRDCREVMDHAGAAGLGERVGCSWRVAAHRVGSEDGCADEAGTGCADQGPSHPAAERGISGAPQAGGAGQDQRPGHGEVRGLDLAAWPERQRADRMARRAVPVPGRALGEECRDEDRPGGQTAVQQTASPSRRPALHAGGFHEQTVANRGGEEGTPPDEQGRQTPRSSHQCGPSALTTAPAAAGRPGIGGGRMTADGRWCRFPGPTRKACLLQLPGAVAMNRSCPCPAGS
jgi:hypothetical protein